MQLLKIYSENLYSFLKLDLDLTTYAQGTTIILGKNLDMDSSNGAGKSNILKIIYFALWGSDYQNIPLGEIIHDQSDGSYFIYLDFSDGQDNYRIIRYEGYDGVAPITLPDGKKIKGKGTHFLINGESLFETKESGKTSVQPIINKKLGMSPDIFLNSVFTPQTRQKPFLEASDTDKKEVLSDILALNYYDTAGDLLDKDIKAKNDLIKNYDRKIELNDQKKLDLKKNIDELEQKISVISKEYTTKREELKTKIANLKVELLELSTKIDDSVISDLTDLKKEVITLKGKIISIENTLKDKNKIIALKSKLQSDISSFNKNYQQIESIISEIESETGVVTSEVSELNKTPYKDYSPEIKEKQSLLIQKKTKESEMKSLNDQVNLKNQDFNKLAYLLETRQKDENSLVVEIERINEENSCQSCLRPFKEGESSILGDLLNKKQNEIRIVQDQISTVKQNKEKISKDIETLTNNIKLIEEQIKPLIPVEKELQELLVLEEKNKNLKEKEKSLNQRIVVLQSNKLKKENELILLKTTNEKNNLELAKIEPILELLEQEEIKLKQLRDNFESTTKSLSDKELVNQSFSALIENKKNKEDLLSGMTSRLQELETNRRNYQELFNRQKEELVLCENIEKDIITKSNEQKEELKYLLFWENGFSKSGIRSFIIDDVIDFLNQKVKENLEILSNGTTNLIFEPEKTSKKGVTSNSITTKFFINGRPRRLKLHSGGEAERCTIAVDLALSDLAESRSGNRFSIRFLDEPFSAFDTKPQLKSFALFNKAAEEKQGFFIISHNKEFQQYCDHSIYVVKENGVSRLVDQATFMNIGENNA